MFIIKTIIIMCLFECYLNKYIYFKIVKLRYKAQYIHNTTLNIKCMYMLLIK